MAWTDPKTWSPGDVLTAADLNTYIRDNTNDRPRVRVLRTSSQACSNNTDTAVIWDTESIDVGGFWDSGSPTVLTIPFDGDYLVGYGLCWNAHADGGWRQGKLWKNSSSANGLFLFSQLQPDAASSPQSIVNVASDVLSLVAGDTLGLIANQGSGVAVNIFGNGTTQATYFWATLLG